ncbi:MAG: histidine kinase dimerization/phosphoacceptor domain -containing protein [Hyphomicrobiales bacterium]|nr:histidine kinase dimerization/phosphoacceptor domain -containing protein [Hyphomicrobiales bacterium]
MSESRRHILIIDDDLAFCRLVSRNLERAAYAVEAAHDCKTGMRRLSEAAFDLVILDHHLPDKDGIEALVELKAMEKSPPVIYLTGSDDSRVAVSALKAGASDYVTKDVHGDFLVLLNAAIGSALMAAYLQRAKEAAEAAIVEARDRYKALADERALLLKEVNHRVGNSLQLIASLLHLQTRATEKDEVKDALSEAHRRVMAVAQVHRRLYTSDSVQSVSLRDYLQALTHDIQGASGNEHAGISISLDADDVSVEPDRAVALGIMVTELVLNAMKHAYPSGDGPVRIALRQREDGAVELSVSDDGVGLDASPSPTARPAAPSSGLGKTIIRAMAQKLSSEVTYDRAASGTRAVLIFSPAAQHPAAA